MGARVTGADRLLADLAKVEDLAGDLRPVWPQLAKMWAAREAAVFAGARWAPFAARTLVRHSKPGKGPMVDKGALVDAMTGTKPRYEDEQMLVLGPPKSADGEGGTNSIGARHVRGTNYMPARKLVPNITAAERRRMITAIRKHLTEGL